MSRHAVWIVLLGGLLAVTARAQDADLFSIRGRVVDAAAKPLANVQVRLLAAGPRGFDVDERTTTDAMGRFRIVAPDRWTWMNASLRQELAVVAVHQDRIAAVQFHRNSAPPQAEVELRLPDGSGTELTVLSPDRRPLPGAKVRIGALNCDTIYVGLTDAEARRWGQATRKTSIGDVVGTGTANLPPDLQFPLGSTDRQGVLRISHFAAARIGAVVVQTEEFGEQTVARYSYAFQRVKPSDWPSRIVLKNTGRISGQLTGPSADAVAGREVTLTSLDQDWNIGVSWSSTAKVTTDRDGKFTVPKMVAGTVRIAVKFDPSQPLRPQRTTKPPQLKADDTLHLQVDLKPAVRVEGQVLEAAGKRPIPGVRIRAFLGMGSETATSDAQGKFVFWAAPGDCVFNPDIAADYLPALSVSDYGNPASRRKSIGIFKVPAGKSFTAPPLLLLRRATVRGVVVDDLGRPLPGTTLSGIALSVDHLTGVPRSREFTAQTDSRGEFTIARVDPREPLRLRVTARQSSKVVTVAKPGSEPLRVVLSPNEQFTITGRVADAEGKPVADGRLEIWHRDWRPSPVEAEPKKVELKMPLRTDAEGRFQTPPLFADGSYRFTIRAAGAKTTESAWLDATDPAAKAVQELIVTRLGGLSGVVRDRSGQPIADAEVALLAADTRTETVTDRHGKFSVVIPAGKPFCLIVRHPDFRLDGTFYEKKPPNLDHSLSRLTEPGTALARRTILGRAEREKAIKRLLEKVKQRLVESKSTDDKVMRLQSLTRVAPDFVTEFLDKNPLPSAQFNEMLRLQVVRSKVEKNPEEAEELIGRIEPGAQKTLVYGLLLDGLPQAARPRKLEILAEALVAARAETSPEFRAIALGEVGQRLCQLGENDRGTSILREGEKIAGGLSTDGYAGFARGVFATDLAVIDLPKALALMKGLTDREEFARHHGNTAHRLSGRQPAEAVKVLNLIPPPKQNQFNRRDSYAIRVCYRMAQVDQSGALRLAESIVDLPSRAYAIGVIAQSVARTDRQRALDLLRRAYAVLEQIAARPDAMRLTSPLNAGTVAAALVLITEQVDPATVRESLWRAAALERSPTSDPQYVWNYVRWNSALAIVAARYDGKLAAYLLASVSSGWKAPAGYQVAGQSEVQLAGFLVHPMQALPKPEQASDPRGLVQLIGFLATDEEHLPRKILNTLGIWRPDAEDYDE